MSVDSTALLNQVREVERHRASERERERERETISPYVTLTRLFSSLLPHHPSPLLSPPFLAAPRSRS